MFPELTESENLLIKRFVKQVMIAREKHPGFANGIHEALSYLSEEHGEVVKAITKNEGMERVDSELFDLMAVAFRLLSREYQ